MPCRALLRCPGGVGGLLGFRRHYAHFTAAERLQLARLGAALGVVALSDRRHLIELRRRPVRGVAAGPIFFGANRQKAIPW